MSELIAHFSKNALEEVRVTLEEFGFFVCFLGIPKVKAHDEPSYIKNVTSWSIIESVMGTVLGTKYKIYWDNGNFAGNLGSKWDLNSVFNDFGLYGSEWGIDSIWNPANQFRSIYIYEIMGW